MQMKNLHIGLGSLLNAVFDILVSNPIILYPVIVLGFIQLLFLEIIYFAPRYPLSELFGPIIVKSAGPAFLHYPYNYLLLSKWFHSVEICIAIFISCIFYAASVLIISLINSGKPVSMKKVFQRVLSSYIHLVAAMILAAILIQGLTFLHGLALKRALLIRSDAGIFFLIKEAVIISAPYFRFLLACLVTALLAFVVPIIMLEQKKIITAIKLNFMNYSRCFGSILGVVIASGFLYLPIIFWQSFQTNDGMLKAPEMSGLFLVLSILMMLFIDTIQYTAITLCYLLVKEVP
jgi:hypothetical protein